MLVRPIAVAVAGLLTLAILLGLFSLYQHMYPFRAGNPRDFWLIVSRIDLGADFANLGGSAVRRENRWIYTVEGLHGPVAYQISETDAMKDFPRIEAALRRVVTLNDPDDYRVRAFRRWKSLNPPYNNSPEALSLCIDEAMFVRTAARPTPYMPTGFPLTERPIAERMAQVGEYYFLNFVFEALYLSFIVWFGFWPIIRDRSRLRRYVHLALVPLLFYLPYWFGYGILTTVRPWGPTGGILYSWLLYLSPPLVHSVIDFRFLSAFPPIMAALNQGMPVTFEEIGLMPSEVPVFGPLDVGLRCAMFAGAYGVLQFIKWALGGRKRKKEKLHAFPVVLDQPARPA